MPTRSVKKRSAVLRHSSHRLKGNPAPFRKFAIYNLIYFRNVLDEYDTPIQQGHTQGYYEKIISFMRNLFSGGLKDNKHLSFGFLTGILRVAKESIFSGLNTDEGRYDLQMEPKDYKLPGIIIELKAEKNGSKESLTKLSQTALQQINDRKYDTEMRSRGIHTIYKYGVAFSGKDVVVTVG